MADARDDIIAGLVAAVGPLIGEITQEVATLRHMIDTASDPRIAAELSAEADRLGMLADTAARAVAAAKALTPGAAAGFPEGPRSLPVLNDTVEVRP